MKLFCCRVSVGANKVQLNRIKKCNYETEINAASSNVFCSVRIDRGNGIDMIVSLDDVFLPCFAFVFIKWRCDFQFGV